jgi:hypothetical protein
MHDAVRLKLPELLAEDLLRYVRDRALAADRVSLCDPPC